MWLILEKLPIKAGWWDASFALRDVSQSNKHSVFKIYDTDYLSVYHEYHCSYVNIIRTFLQKL